MFSLGLTGVVRTSILETTLNRRSPFSMPDIQRWIETNRIINSPARRSPVLEAVLNGAHRSSGKLEKVAKALLKRCENSGRAGFISGETCRPDRAISDLPLFDLLW